MFDKELMPQCATHVLDFCSVGPYRQGGDASKLAVDVSKDYERDAYATKLANKLVKRTPPLLNEISAKA